MTAMSVRPTAETWVIPDEGKVQVVLIRSTVGWTWHARSVTVSSNSWRPTKRWALRAALQWLAIFGHDPADFQITDS